MPSLKTILTNIKRVFLAKQNTILSAAGLIMFMIIASRILGLVRQRVLAHYFLSSELSLFFAAFRLPDTIFEVLVFGTFASAFIPVFSKVYRDSKKDAWKLAGIVANWGIIFFILLALIVIVFADYLYAIVTPGFGPNEQDQIVLIARLLFAAQGFFVISYVLTAVLESSKRFFVSSLAPLFYNLGIIILTILLSGRLGLLAPALGVVVGALLHFLIQLPLALRLGFRFIPSLKIGPDVKKIAKLSIPRMIEVSFLQLAKFAELSLASLISLSSYTYFTFGNTIQLLPVGLFGTSIAKAALPTLASQADDLNLFKKTLFDTLNQIVFLMTPIVVFLIVARVPIVRLVFGTDIFTWDSTVQTSLVVSAFAIGIFSQSANSILARSFYALSDTKTPVFVSVPIILFNILLNIVFVMVYKLPVWSLALSFSVSSILQTMILFILINKRISGGPIKSFFVNLAKSVTAGLLSFWVMYFILKFFDKSAWIKRLSFLTSNDFLPFEMFVLDTRYTVNLMILTFFVAVFGIGTYFIVLILLKSEELSLFKRLFARFIKSPAVEETRPS